MDSTFIASNLYSLSEIPIFEFSQDNLQLSALSSFNVVIPQFIQSQIIKMARMLNSESKRLLFKDYPGLPVCICLYKSLNGHIYEIGPVIYRTLSQEQKHQLKRLSAKENKEINFPSTNHSRIIAFINIFVYAIDKIFLSPLEFSSSEIFDEYRHEITNDVIHELVVRDYEFTQNHTFPDEQYTLELIKKGNVEDMQKHMFVYDIAYPQIFPNRPLKTDEYMAVSAIGIMARAAIEGGATSTDSFLLSDIFMKKISECKSRNEIISIRNKAFVEFARLVHDKAPENGTNIVVNDCKKYISSNIRKKISLDDVANAFDMDKTYLARIFSASEGISVGQFIRREKMKLARNFLTYSGYSITEIAQYLGYDSQSYFGKIFHEDTGITPKQYRKEHHSAEF